MFELLEGLLGANDGVSIIGEARESVAGGCWGLLMSSVYIFAFFMGLFAWMFGVESDTFTFRVSGAAPLVLVLLLVSALLSPIVGILLGMQGGRYRLWQHIVFFLIWLGIQVGAIIALSSV